MPDYEVGRPFQGESGRLIEQLIDIAGLRNHWKIGFTSAVMCMGTTSNHKWRPPNNTEINNCSHNLDMVVERSKCTHVVRVGKIVQKMEFNGLITVDIHYPNTMLTSGCTESEAFKDAICELSCIPPF